MKLLAEYVALDSWQQSLQSPYLVSIVFCEVISLFLWLRVLAVMPVSRAVPITAISYVLVLMLGWFGFQEPLYPAQLIGSFFILLGVRLLSTSSCRKFSNVPVVL